MDLDLEKFKRRVDDPKRSQNDLEKMLKNALDKQRHDCADYAREKLNTRFPEWNKPVGKRGGSRPTVVAFKGEEREFPSAKEAYLWIVDQFIKTYSKIFTEINWETEFIAKGTKRLYFGRNPESLFFGSPHLSDDANNYAQLNNGWYANVNLSNDQKLDVLMKFAAVAKLSWERDWYWTVLGQL